MLGSEPQGGLAILRPWHLSALFTVGVLLTSLALPWLPSILNRSGPIKSDSLDFAHWLQIAMPVLGVIGSIVTLLLRSRKIGSETVALLIPIFTTCIWAWMKLTLDDRNTAYVRLVGEDSPIEWLGFFCLAAATVFFSLASAQHLKLKFWHGTIALLLWVAATLFGVMEEVSYGQRIVGFDTPDAYLSANSQGEFNFHNLTSLDKISQYFIPMVLSLYCIMAGLRLYPVIPSSKLWSQTIAPFFYVLRAPRWTVPWFGVFAWSLIVDYGSRHAECFVCARLLTWPDNEIFELIFSVALGVTAFESWRRGPFTEAFRQRHLSAP